MAIYEFSNEIVTVPARSHRKSRRLSRFRIHPFTHQTRAGTVKFDELNFHNALPLPGKEKSLSREPSFDSLLPPKPSPRFSDLPLWWTSLIVASPILAFTLTFVGFVVHHHLADDASHPFITSSEPTGDGRFILVNFSATRLVFIASSSSTVAPMLLGSLMTLWHIPTARRLAAITKARDVQELPTPHQLSMLIGLSAGSLDELRRYLFYRFNAVKARQPRILTRSALVLLVSFLLAALIFAADTAIHAYTTTIPYSQTSLSDEVSLQYGRGLMRECIGLDRAQNQGLPCTVLADASVGANAVARDAGEIISLGRNESLRNSIWTVESEALQHGDLLILLPQTKDIPVGLDYSASTVGVSTQCVPSSWQCNVRMSDDASSGSSYIVFNCTDNFRGVLGAGADIVNNTIIWSHAEDSTTPNFNVKSDRNFQYAYFSDAELDDIYNSIGANQTNDGNSGELALPDSALLNPIHLGVAGLIPVQNGEVGRSLAQDEALFRISDNLIAYTLNCSVTSYDVEYTWINGSVHSLSFEATTNGSLLELAHGMQAVGMPSLSQSQSFASLTSSADGLARRFANSHSVDSLALMGSVMSPRTNRQEATTDHLLVSQVDTLALAFLLVVNTLFVVFAAALIFRAWCVHNPDTRDMVARLSVEGLAAMAFEDTVEKRVRRVNDTNQMFEESRIGDVSRKVGLMAYTGGGHVMVVEQPRL